MTLVRSPFWPDVLRRFVHHYGDGPACRRRDGQHHNALCRRQPREGSRHRWLGLQDRHLRGRQPIRDRGDGVFTNPLSALVTDGYGNPVWSAVVAFTAAASGASGTFLAASNGETCLATGGTPVASCTAVMGMNGIASSLTYTANDTAGSYNVAVTSPATTPNPLNFAETNTPALPSKVVFTTEPPATGTAGTALTTFKVSVEDQFGNTVTTGAGSTDGITLSIHTGPAGGVFNSAAGTYTNVGLWPEWQPLAGSTSTRLVATP